LNLNLFCQKIYIIEKVLFASCLAALHLARGVDGLGVACGALRGAAGVAGGVRPRCTHLGGARLVLRWSRV